MEAIKPSRGPIIDKYLLAEAASWVIPFATQLLAEEGTTWGPNWGTLVIQFEDLTHESQVNQPQMWDPEWGSGPLDFSEIANQKRSASHAEQCSTRELVHLWPHLLGEGDYLYIGGVHRDGITAAFSGAKSEVDEAIANIAIDIVMMLVQLKKRALDEAEIDRL